jgi:hypothetical protein
MLVHSPSLNGTRSTKKVVKSAFGVLVNTKIASAPTATPSAVRITPNTKGLGLSALKDLFSSCPNKEYPAILIIAKLSNPILGVGPKGICLVEY